MDKKIQNLMKKLSLVCGAVAFAPALAMAQEASTPLTDMVTAVDVSDATGAITKAAAILIGLGVLTYCARRVLAFFGR